MLFCSSILNISATYLLIAAIVCFHAAAILKLHSRLCACEHVLARLVCDDGPPSITPDGLALRQAQIG